MARTNVFMVIELPALLLICSFLFPVHYCLILYLIDMENKLGVSEPVYCVYDYNPQNNDELKLRNGDKLTILRRGDDSETDWWWAKLGDQEGYVAKNLLTVG